jgi:hypothetical protein
VTVASFIVGILTFDEVITLQRYADLVKVFVECKTSTYLQLQATNKREQAQL